MTRDYEQGYLDGLKSSAWLCGDCGNTYEPSVDECPNLQIDEATARLRKAETTLQFSVQLENSDVRLIVHPEGQCVGEYCTVHNRSEHHMREWPQQWRSDRGIMERICPHGVGHPDPDEIHKDTVHGCDGCCAPPPWHNETTINEWRLCLERQFYLNELAEITLTDGRVLRGKVNSPHWEDHLFEVAGMTINTRNPSPLISKILPAWSAEHEDGE